MEKTYIDVEGLEKISETEHIPAGKRFDAFVMTCEENGFTSLQRKRNINLIWEGMLPKLDFYPVPSLTFFAHDGRGGYFAHSGKGLESSIYFVSDKLECWYLAENFRTFVQMVVFEPDWKEKITGEKQEFMETEEELADFDVNPVYGYAFRFVSNGDSSSISVEESDLVTEFDRGEWNR
jgi:hypothetical protein